MQYITNLTSRELLLSILKGSAATLGLFLLFFFAGPLIGIFVPFPVLYYTIKSGKWAGIAIVSLDFVLYFINPAFSTLYFFLCGIFALLLAGFLCAGYGSARTIVRATILELLVILSAVIVYMLWTGIDPHAIVLKEINNFVSLAGAFYQKAGWQGTDLDIMQRGLREAAKFFEIAYPAFMIVYIGAIGGFNVRLLKKAGHLLPKNLHLGDFKKFKIPEYVIWILISSGFALFFADALTARSDLNFDVLSCISLNVLVVTLALYFVQGLSITAYFFDRFRIPSLLRVLFYFLLFLQPYMLVTVAAFGVFDLWCDFRTPKIKENL